MSSSSNESSPAPTGLGPKEEARKRRRRDVATWKRNVQKKRRDAGEEYTSTKTGAIVPARQVGPSCTCPKKCYDIVGRDNINQVFENYWKIGSHDGQSAYLAAHVFVKPVARKYAGDDSRRKVTYEYSVEVNGEQKVVCKVSFINIHGISNKRVQNVVAKVGKTGVSPHDKRGRAPSIKKTPDDVMQQVQSHILSLPTCASHYSRAKSKNRVYLPPGFSHRKCYELYEKDCADKGIPADKVVSFDVYRFEFMTYNISVSPPRVDTCSFCDKTKLDIEQAKMDKDDSKLQELITTLRLHNLRANVAQDLMQTYAEDNDVNTMALAMDLQQTLVTPSLHTNVAYYKRKLWTYNFGIHNLKTTKAYFYVWNETVAKRGSSEIGSCLINFIFRKRR